MHLSFISLTILLPLLAFLLAPPAKAASSSNFSAIDAYLESQRQKQHIPGLALVIVQGDKVAYSRGYGQAGPGRPVTAQTPFIIGSTTKSFTALAIMQQVEAGVIDLDAPIQRYLPWFTLADPDESAQITVRMLLGHTSGLPNASGENMMAERDPNPAALEHKVRSLEDVRVAHQPGTTHEYSNSNYAILGLILETVTGQDYDDYIEAHIFTPLGMRHAHTSRPEAEADGMADGYRYWFGLPFPAGDTPFSFANLPSGWLMLSAEDIGPYLIAHLNEGRCGDTQVVSAGGMRKLHTPISRDYAMGWAKQNGLLIHNGSVPDFGSTFLLDPRQKIGVALLWNVNTGGGFIPAYGLAENVWRMLTDRQPAPLPSDPRYANFLILLGGLLLLELAWLAISLRLLGSWRSNLAPRGRRMLVSGLAALIQFILGIVLIVMLSQQARPVQVMFLYVPDLMTLAALILVLAFVWGGLLPFLALGRIKAQNNQPVYFS